MPENQLVPTQPDGLEVMTGLDPARAYLLTLRSQASRATMRKRLDQIARMYLHSQWDTCRWDRLEKWRFDAIVDAEFDRVSVAYTNQMIAAVRGALAQKPPLYGPDCRESPELGTFVRQIDTAKKRLPVGKRSDP